MAALPPLSQRQDHTLLKIEDLHVEFKGYGGTLKVLDGVDFRMHAGENVGLVGETGCGKTTTMKSILRILPMPPARITRGKIYFKGRDVLEMKQSELQRVRSEGISMIFQDPTAALNPVFTVGEQLRAVVQHSVEGKHLSKKEIRERTLKPLRDVSLPDPERMLNTYPIQLSGGMRQRICIAMALVASRELLIADEPGTSLDVTIQDQILRLLQDLVEDRDVSVILITHTLGVVRETTDRVYVMYAGRMVEVADTQALFNDPLHPYTHGLMEAVPRITGGGVADGIAGRIPDYMNPPEGCRFHPRCPRGMSICQQEKPRFYQVDDNHEVACFLYRDDER